MTRNEYWRRSYDEHRYMRLLSQPELNRRFRDVLLNFLRLTGDAKIGLAPIADDGHVWMEKITHVLEEMQLRHGPYPNGFSRAMTHTDEDPFPDFVSELAKKAAAKMASLNLKRGDAFIKFGKREFMEKLHTFGDLRVQPASFFANKAHNIAVRDDELSFEFSFALSRDEIIKLVANPEDVKPDTKDQRVNLNVRCPTDYWLYCVTHSVEPRLFVDFSADACVIIRNKAAFKARLEAAAKENSELSQSGLREGDALYVDPLLPAKDVARPDMFIPLAKHFAYSYQDEYRFCWMPKGNRQNLRHIDLQLGSLSDIAELVVL
jgi:hypothetical protein